MEMKRSSIVALGAVLSVVACTDNPVVTGPVDPSQPIQPTPSMATIEGRVIVTGAGSDQLVELKDGNGNVYRVVGSQSASLASVDGGDVLARGTFDANPGFVVQEFQVTGMHGRAALDGVLEITESGFALRLHNGTLRVIPSLGSDCAEYVGARLWVIGFEDPSGAQFGRIGAQ
jgi:hypothetical protein